MYELGRLYYGTYKTNPFLHDCSCSLGSQLVANNGSMCERFKPQLMRLAYEGLSLFGQESVALIGWRIDVYVT